MSNTTTPPAAKNDYCLDQQVGFMLRRATQRHLALFANQIAQLTPTQFATLAKLCELGPTSQNALGRQTAMDAATIKGVVDRLRRKQLLTSQPDPNDQRRVVVAASDAGVALFETLWQSAAFVSIETLAPLNPDEQETFLALLQKLA